MQSEKNTQEEVHSVSCKDKTVTIQNFTPVYTAEEQNKVEAEISNTLYEIFSKYKK